MVGVMKAEVMLIGAGDMAIEYTKVLSGMGVNYIIVGRGEQSAARCEELSGHSVYRGGIEKYLAEGKEIPEKAIVVVYPLSLKMVAEQLIHAGVKEILLEKPGGMDLAEITELSNLAKDKGVSVYVAYNRRFYASVAKAKELIEQDGGVSSFNFEFTEWSHRIEELPKPKGELEGWFMANSTHVVDLAFFLGGEPKEMSSYVCGSIPWYSKASAFAGSGITKEGAVFSYKANWKSAGRWSVEILTQEHKFLFEPMEQLRVQNRGEIKVEQLDIDDEIDIKYKAGLYKEVEAFLTGNTEMLPDIHEQKRNAIVYQLMETTGHKVF
ncbi:hypothetical protein NZ47_03470 [Anaerovibrio lipolyticus]|uniref:Gfo/Idh/MocA-like oxidoreductase N-terminal domain-containing protein n=2 Tax=Anaerovibrio lipolyticus TaxID=82374 RepID=A0A0B2JYM8_9FIRM|nr:hypothetical protein NZ47_03470 [Anaerovibrio lipolyticus]